MNQNCRAHSAGLLRARSQPLPRLPIWRLTVVFLSQRVLAPIMRKQELCLNMILMPVLSFQHSYSDREELLQRLWPGRATRETMTTRQRPMTEKTGTVGRRIRQNQKFRPAARPTVILLRGYKAAPPCPLSSSPLFL